MGLGAGGSSLLGGGGVLPPPPPPPRAPGECQHALVVSNLVSEMSSEALRQLFSPFGAVADVVLLPAQAGASARQALLAFALPGEGGVAALAALADVVISTMTGVAAPAPMILARAPMELLEAHLPALAAAGPLPTPVLELCGIVVVGAEVDFGSAEEVADLREDVALECAKSGRVAALLIPAPAAGAPQGTSVPIYVAFEGAAAAAACSANMRAKRFSGRPVLPRYVPADEWERIRAKEEAAGAGAGAGAGEGRSGT